LALVVLHQEAPQEPKVETLYFLQSLQLAVVEVVAAPTQEQVVLVVVLLVLMVAQ
jgi:hypothetical protein